jgi:hypothetical protein
MEYTQAVCRKKLAHWYYDSTCSNTIIKSFSCPTVSWLLIQRTFLVHLLMIVEKLNFAADPINLY